jgi:hypothetical protein
MIDGFSTLFASQYGLRNALILSEICFVSETKGTVVNGLYLRERFPYLSRDQIRKALESLVDKGMLERVRSGEFTRELCYRAVESAVTAYLCDINMGGSYLSNRLPVKPEAKRVKV